MKTPFLLKLILIGFLVSNCSSNDADPTPDSVTAITLTSSVTEVNTGSQVTFSVKSNLNTDLSSQSTYKLDGVITTNPIVFNSVGSFQVTAEYDGLTSNALTITVEDDPPTSIVLSFDQVCFVTGDSATFTVVDNFNNTVTTEAEVTVNGTVMSNPYQFTVDGTYSFVATYEGLTSNTVTFNVETGVGAPSTYTKKALLEDFTGTWCPQCPPAAAAIANAKNGNPNIIGVGYHAGNDPMEIPETAYWSNYYNVTGFPTVYVNGPDTRWNFPYITQVNAELAETATVGLALEATLVAGKLNLDVQVGFNSTPNEEVKLMVYLVEDNVTTSTPQAGSSQGADYVHRDVLREVYTDQLGECHSEL